MDINTLVGENQCIKIVPSLEDSLRNIGFNVVLDETTILWFQQLRSTWKTWKKSTTVENLIQNHFQNIEDPFGVALAVLIRTDLKDCRSNTLPYLIIDVLYKWSKNTGSLPAESLKLPAFHVTMHQRNQQFLNLMVNTYHIKSIKAMILPLVRETIEQGNYKKACQITIAMELFEEVPVEDLLFPVLLQDNHNLVDDYLSQSPKHLLPFLNFIDKLLDKTICLRDYIQLYIDKHKISDIKYNKLHYKPLGKMAARLCNKFKIPITTCKNLSKNRTVGGLHYLIHQKYEQHNITTSVWEDLVKDALEQNKDSAIDFISYLAYYDVQESLKWAQYLNLPLSDYPPSLKLNMSFNYPSPKTDENWEATPSGSQDYYKLSLHLDQITIIDTPDTMLHIITTDLKSCDVLGIDCEWKPSFGTTPPQVALIQIAKSDTVYLIDSLKLNKPEFIGIWQTFTKCVLDNAEIIKVGFGIDQDLKEMKSKIIGMNNLKVKGEGLLDLSILWKVLIDVGMNLSAENEIAGSSLSCVVQSCFGLPLSKSEQCSNWEIRPLRSTQIEYAALDAFVLMEIYLYLKKLCLSQGMNFDEICNNIMIEGKQKYVKKLVEKSVHSPSSTPQLVSQVKFLVEPKLSNLLAYLRYCGIDTMDISPSMEWHEVINEAISDSRFILVSKMKISPTQNYRQSFILDASGVNIKAQIQKILTYFRISLKQDDILSRCIFCNSSDVKKLTSTEIVDLCDKFSNTLKVKSYQDYAPEYHDDYDNFLSDSDDDNELYQPIAHNIPTTSSCTTSKGIPIHIDNVEDFLESKSTAVLCETCGKLLGKGVRVLNEIADLMSSFET